MCAEAKDSGMKTLIALDDQEELIDKFEAAADGINADMALAEKALKVGSSGCPGAASLRLAAEQCLLYLHPSQHHHLRGLRLSSHPSFCTFDSLFENLINSIYIFDNQDYQISF